ncbi:hypothetical protein NE237_016934 [Protea cynaroides]|uniref:Leucine-rich repeat-containing N-terminal plant-type domain-containing protein n=1 Tax=Protea cynaroides TaxID=273540 RepID=A0A9Q0HFY3_9MAGN|nr:hypothetical protein NE237_016934 [Protea cynaroides]
MDLSTFTLLVLLSFFLLPFANTSATIDGRSTLQIIIGGGGGGGVGICIGECSPPAPPPEQPECPPPPPPPEPECPPPPSPPPPPPPPSPPPPPPSPPPPSPPPPPPPPSPPPPSPPPLKPKPPPSPKSQPPPSPPAPLFENENLRKAYYVIQRLKTKITCDPKNISKTWTGRNPCNYKGFQCGNPPDIKNRTVATVDFNGFGFAGEDLTLTGFLDMLPDITYFHANSNNFTGSLPLLIGTKQIRFFYELDVSNNKLTGQFPTSALEATQLTFLDLRFNKFSGTVPPQVFLLDLDVLFLNNNDFTQNLPTNLGSTPVLYLSLANSKYTGPIPPSICQANRTLLEVLFLNNSLSGCLPYQIGFLYLATVFDAGFNQLTGSIPQSLGCLEKIQQLNFAVNLLYGAVPEVVCELPMLRNLSLSYNYFTQVGPMCRKLIMNKVLDVRMNCILDLPEQRSAAECAWFFSKPKICPDQNSRWMKYMPCKRSSFSQAASPASSPSPSYSALKEHN